MVVCKVRSFSPLKGLDNSNSLEIGQLRFSMYVNQIIPLNF